MAGASPASSPRLPSPPPMAEDQLGPMSPTAALSEESGKMSGAMADTGASRRIRPGTKAEDMAEGPPLVDIAKIESAFQLMEHLQALHHSYTHPSNTSHTVPLDRVTATHLSQPPDGVNRDMWLYELCRFLIQRVNSVIVALFADDPPCSANTCQEMRASEWQYLCAVHDPPKSCCAIDYCCHTLDWAANILTSPKQFPSRLALGTGADSAQNQVRQLNNIFRRVYRIFAHAWFQHRDMFWKVENRSGLYILFKTVCEYYSIMGEDNFTIPPEAEGTDVTPITKEINTPSILKRGDDGREQAKLEQVSGAANDTIATGNTTRRHKHTPSSAGAHVSTVIEEAEDEDGNDGRMEDVSLERDEITGGPASAPVSEERLGENLTEPSEDEGGIGAPSTTQSHDWGVADSAMSQDANPSSAPPAQAVSEATSDHPEVEEPEKGTETSVNTASNEDKPESDVDVEAESKPESYSETTSDVVGTPEDAEAQPKEESMKESKEQLNEEETGNATVASKEMQVEITDPGAKADDGAEAGKTVAD